MVDEFGLLNCVVIKNFLVNNRYLRDYFDILIFFPFFKFIRNVN